MSLGGSRVDSGSFASTSGTYACPHRQGWSISKGGRICGRRSPGSRWGRDDRDAYRSREKQHTRARRKQGVLNGSRLSNIGANSDSSAKADLNSASLAGVSVQEEHLNCGAQHIPLMDEEHLDTDPSTDKELTSSSHSISSFFTATDWEYHQSATRYFRNLLNIRESTVYKRILAPCLTVTAFSALVALYNSTHTLPMCTIATTPHTLLGSALSLLLVFRTNASYARLVEGRRMWGQLVRNAREWIRLTAVYFPRELHPESLAYVQAFAISTKGRVRPGRFRRDPNDVTACRYDMRPKLLKVLGPETTEYLVAALNPPGVCARGLSRVLLKAVQRPAPIPLFVAQRAEEVIKDMVHAASASHRLFETPIPVSYTRHTSRSLMLWLLSLPFALWTIMGTSMVPACLVISYVLIGIDELGIQIEEPSSILPLVPMMNKIRFEVQAVMREMQHPLQYAT
ncbi:g4553 [Coccomyxa viridis]|uniref:G4553 protein n=1 Tax=Coccomyxa viridis TaxID=1274662 RepID=A0ABP1FS32_9CHLO